MQQYRHSRPAISRAQMQEAQKSAGQGLKRDETALDRERSETSAARIAKGSASEPPLAWGKLEHAGRLDIIISSG